MVVVPLQQTILESTEAEEVVLLFEMVNRALMDRAEFVVNEFVIGEVLLARHAVLT